MKIFLKLVLLLLATQLIVSCGNIEGELEDALVDGISKDNPELSIPINQLALQVIDVTADKKIESIQGVKDFMPIFPKPTMLVRLQQAGYVSTKSEPIGMTFTSKYKITKKGKSIFNKPNSWRYSLSFGERKFSKITEYILQGDNNKSNVEFSYDLKFNKLAKDLGLKKEFRKLDSKKGRAYLQKTSNGWKVVNISWNI